MAPTIFLSGLIMLSVWFSGCFGEDADYPPAPYYGTDYKNASSYYPPAPYEPKPEPAPYYPKPPVYYPNPPVYYPNPPVYYPNPPVYYPNPPVYYPNPPVYYPKPPKPCYSCPLTCLNRCGDHSGCNGCLQSTCFTGNLVTKEVHDCYKACRDNKRETGDNSPCHVQSFVPGVNATDMIESCIECAQRCLCLMSTKKTMKREDQSKPFHIAREKMVKSTCSKQFEKVALGNKLFMLSTIKRNYTSARSHCANCLGSSYKLSDITKKEIMVGSPDGQTVWVGSFQNKSIPKLQFTKNAVHLNTGDNELFKFMCSTSHHDSFEEENFETGY